MARCPYCHKDVTLQSTIKDESSEVQKEVEGTSKALLLLTGASAAGMSIFAILHNLVTAMFIKFFKVSKNFDEPVFFILATVVCPLGFLVGAVGTLAVSK